MHDVPAVVGRKQPADGPLTRPSLPLSHSSFPNTQGHVAAKVAKAQAEETAAAAAAAALAKEERAAKLAAASEEDKEKASCGGLGGWLGSWLWLGRVLGFHQGGLLSSA